MKKHLEMEEIPVLLSDRDKKARFPEPDCSSPEPGSSKSVKSSAFEFWMDQENLVDFKLIDSPKLQKHSAFVILSILPAYSNWRILDIHQSIC